jgi:hypothetical protein
MLCVWEWAFDVSLFLLRRDIGLSSLCSPSANYYGEWMEMNAIYECQNIHGRRKRIEMMSKSEVQSKEAPYSLALLQSFVNTNVWTYERKHPGDFHNQSNQRGIQ